jgi:putative transposase
MARPALKRPVVEYIRDHYGVPRRRACRLVGLHRSVFYYRSMKNPRLELRGRMRELARSRVRYGYRRLHVLLKREGWSLGRNQAYRLYCEEGLQLRSKRPRRRKMGVTRRERYVPRRVNQAWSMDFVSDQLADGRRIRALTIVDVFSREALAIEVGQRMRAENVVEVCNRLVARRGKPKRVFVDNAYIESFNARLRDECLNSRWFESVDDARQTL